jgi:hypothetical protein
VTSYTRVDSNCTDNCTFTETRRVRDAVDDGSAGMAIVLLLFIVPKTFSLKGLKAGTDER